MKTNIGTLEVNDEYARLNCRVSAHIKREAELAAAILGQSITNFTETALAEKAQAVLENHQRISLSEQDFARFVNSLANPEPPTPNLRSAVTEFKRLQDLDQEANL